MIKTPNAFMCDYNNANNRLIWLIELAKTSRMIIFDVTLLEDIVGYK
jgi:hypothetical protein